jgi:hypothetical protein
MMVESCPNSAYIPRRPEYAAWKAVLLKADMALSGFPFVILRTISAAQLELQLPGEKEFVSHMPRSNAAVACDDRSAIVLHLVKESCRIKEATVLLH